VTGQDFEALTASRQLQFARQAMRATMMMGLINVILATILIHSSFALVFYQPEQIHIAYGGKTIYRFCNI
jgi:hypothetical protein